ncbi:MAG: hypothetical protein OXU20_12095 [Myxococcales bacterium]|nr:hypothetical protein [Myxococcales bacterium]
MVRLLGVLGIVVCAGCLSGGVKQDVGDAGPRPEDTSALSSEDGVGMSDGDGDMEVIAGDADDPVRPGPVCGDGRIQGGEVCDYAPDTGDTFVIVGSTCASEVPDRPLGILHCQPGCRTFNTEACYAEQPVVCGNGTIEPSEDCDLAPTRPLFRPGDNTCSDVTMGQLPIGALGCTASCNFDLSRCRGREDP